MGSNGKQCDSWQISGRVSGRIILPCAAGVVLLSALAWWLTAAPTGPVVPALKMASALNSNTRAGELLLRSQADGGLLLSWATHMEMATRQVGSAKVEGDRKGRTSYRYDPQTRSIQPISEDTWVSAGGSVCECEYQLHAPDRLAISRDFRLTFDGKPIKTAGGNALVVKYAPHSSRVAVLSADGFRPPGGIFSGGAGATGQHYHQIFSLADGKPIGKPVRLPFKTDEVTLNICWSADERYVVYSDVLVIHFCVVDVPALEDQALATRPAGASQPVSFDDTPPESPDGTSGGSCEAQPPPACTQTAPADLPTSLTLDLGNDVKMELLLIPPGAFRMGSTKCESPGFSDGPACPRHLVRICRAFYIGKYEVTQAQWQAVMGNNPSENKGSNLPVDSVSWNDCQEFCRRLSRAQGRTVRLPSEAEWEYACRGGTTGDYYIPQPTASDWASEREWAIMVQKEWATIYQGHTAPVGSRKPNPYGLYDMYGNVREWCQDVYHEGYCGAPSDGSAWMTGGHQAERVSRGGASREGVVTCTSADRLFEVEATHNTVDMGLRVVVAVALGEEKNAEVPTTLPATRAVQSQPTE